MEPKPARIAVMVPTRGRAESLARLRSHLEEVTHRPDLVSLWVYGDHQDLGTRRFVEEAQRHPSPLEVRGLLEPDVATQGQRYQRLRAHFQGQAELYFITSDKMQLTTPGWDEVVRRAYRATPDGLLMTFPKDSANHGQFGAFPIVSEAWAQATGKLTTGYFPFWYDDTWLNDVAKLVGRWRALPVGLLMAAGRTQRMFQLRFWEHFYEACFDERLAEGKALLQLMHAKDPVALDLALQRAEAAAKGAFLSPEAWAQRHQELDRFEHGLASRRQGPEPVPPPEDEYWATEAAAVAHLMAKAQGPLLPGQAEAIEAALKLSSQAHELLLLRLKEALAQGAPQSETLLAELLKQFPFRPEAYLLHLQALRQRGQAQAAAEVASLGRQLFPGLPDWQPEA